MQTDDDPSEETISYFCMHFEQAAKAEAEAAAAVTNAQASVIMKLQEQVAALTQVLLPSVLTYHHHILTFSLGCQELDEERQESSRKEVELKSLSHLIKDKERIIHDTNVTLSEAQRTNDSLKERCHSAHLHLLSFL